MTHCAGPDMNLWRAPLVGHGGDSSADFVERDRGQQLPTASKVSSALELEWTRSYTQKAPKLEKRMHRILGGLSVVLLVGALGFSSGCAAEYVHDPNAYFPEDFETAWTKVSDCALSGSHGGKYVVVYANDVALSAFNDTAVTEYPEGSVFAKAQFDAGDCSGSYAAITAMRKDAPGSGNESDWKWQQVSDGGDVNSDTYDAPGCLSCHQAQSIGKDLVATAP